MSKTRKRIRVSVMVTVPVTMSAAAARLEVKTLINHGTTYYADLGDVKALSVKPFPKDK